MAPTAEVQRWSAAAVNWGGNATSTGLSYAINQKLRDWIAVVNANGSNVNKQLELWKDETDSTGTTYQGMVMRIYWGSGVDDHFYFSANGTNTSTIVSAAEVWNDNGSREGYGTFGTGSWYTTDNQSKSLGGAYDVDLYITYDTTNGEEFFSWNWGGQSNNNAYQDACTIYKTNFNNWQVMFNDGSSLKGAAYSIGASGVGPAEDSQTYSNNIGLEKLTLSSSGLSRLGVFPSQSSGAKKVSMTFAKNPFLGSIVTLNSGTYYIVNAGLADETLVVTGGSGGPVTSLGPIDFVNG